MKRVYYTRQIESVNVLDGQKSGSGSFWTFSGNPLKGLRDWPFLQQQGRKQGNNSGLSQTSFFVLFCPFFVWPLFHAFFTWLCAAVSRVKVANIAVFMFHLGKVYFPSFGLGFMW